MTPEDMVMHSASQLQNPQPYGLDPALGPNHGLPYEPDTKYDYKVDEHGPAEHYATSFGERDGQLIEGHAEDREDIDSATVPGDQPKKVSKSSAANELEMRQLFISNKHRTLPDVARELHGNERGPLSERQRQVFAMLWYAIRY
jgi:regulatory factor X